jgi:hypothetical protein
MTVYLEMFTPVAMNRPSGTASPVSLLADLTPAGLPRNRVVRSDDTVIYHSSTAGLNIR